MEFNGPPRMDVAYTTRFLTAFLGEAFDRFGTHMDTVLEDFEFAKRFARRAGELLA